MIYQQQSEPGQIKIHKLLQHKKRKQKLKNAKEVNDGTRLSNAPKRETFQSNRNESPRSSLRPNNDEKPRVSRISNSNDIERGSLRPNETPRVSRITDTNEMPRVSRITNANDIERGSLRPNEMPRVSRITNANEIERGSLRQTEIYQIITNKAPRHSDSDTDLKSNMKYEPGKSNLNRSSTIRSLLDRKGFFNKKGSIADKTSPASFDDGQEGPEKHERSSAAKISISNDGNKSKRNNPNDTKRKSRLLSLFYSIVSKSNPKENESTVGTVRSSHFENVEPSHNDFVGLKKKKSKRKINKLTVSNTYSRTVDITPFFVYLLTLHLNKSSQERQNEDGNYRQCCQTTNILLKKIVAKLGQAEQSKSGRCNDNLKNSCCQCITKGSESEANTNTISNANATKSCLCNNRNGNFQGNYQYNQNMESDCFSRFDQKYSDLYARINALLTPQRDFVVYDMHIPDCGNDLQNRNWPSQIQDECDLKNHNTFRRNTYKFKIPQPIFAPINQDLSAESFPIYHSKTKYNNVETQFPTVVSKSKKETSDIINKKQMYNTVDEPLINMMDNIIKQCLLQDSLREKLGKYFKGPVSNTTAKFHDPQINSRSITNLSQTNTVNKPEQVQSKSNTNLVNESRKPNEHIDYPATESNYDQERQRFTTNNNSISIFDMIYEEKTADDKPPEIIRDKCLNRLNYEKTRDEIEILRNCKNRRLDPVFENLLEKRFNKNSNRYHTFHFRKALNPLCNNVPVQDDNIPTVIQHCINNYYYKKSDSTLIVEPPIILKNYKDFKVENEQSAFNPNKSSETNLISKSEQNTNLKSNIAQETQASTFAIPVQQDNTAFKLERTNDSRLSTILSPRGQSLTKIASPKYEDLNKSSDTKRISISEENRNLRHESLRSSILSNKILNHGSPIQPTVINDFNKSKRSSSLKYDDPNESPGKDDMHPFGQTPIVQDDSSRLSLILSPKSQSIHEEASPERTVNRRGSSLINSIDKEDPLKNEQPEPKPVEKEEPFPLQKAKQEDKQPKEPTKKPTILGRMFGKKKQQPKNKEHSDDSNASLPSDKQKRKKREVKRLPVGAPGSPAYIRPALNPSRQNK